MIPMRNVTNIIKYTRLAPIYDRAFGNRWVRDARRRAYALLPELQPRGRVLLDGIGTGADLPFVTATVRPLGVDLVDAMLRQVRDWCCPAPTDGFGSEDQAAALRR